VALMYEDPWESSYACPGEAPTPAWVLRLLGWASEEALLQAPRSEVEKRCRAVRVAVHPDRPKDSAAQELEGRDAQGVNSALDEVLAAHSRKATSWTREPRWGGANAVYAHPHDLGSDDPPCGVFFTPDPWRPRREVASQSPRDELSSHGDGASQRTAARPQRRDPFSTRESGTPVPGSRCTLGR